MSDADQRAGRIEEIDQQQREDDDQRRRLEDSREVELQEGRRQRRRQRYHAGVFHQAERNADQRHHQDANERRAEHIARVERRDQREAGEREDGGPLLEVAQRHQSGRVIDHDLGLLQCDDEQEKADTRRHRELEISRDRVDDVLAQRRKRNDERKNAGHQHESERLLPRVFVGQHQGEGEERVEPHAGRERDRIIGVERHDQRRDRRRDAGRDEHRALVHPGVGQDRRVDEHDVDHGEERRDARDHLGAHVGAVLLESEITVQKIVHGEAPTPDPSHASIAALRHRGTRPLAEFNRRNDIGNEPVFGRPPRLG